MSDLMCQLRGMRLDLGEEGPDARRCADDSELAGSQHPSAKDNYPQAEERETKSDPPNLALDAPIVPRIRVGVDSEGSLQTRPDRLARSAVPGN